MCVSLIGNSAVRRFDEEWERLRGGHDGDWSGGAKLLRWAPAGAQRAFRTRAPHPCTVPTPPPLSSSLGAHGTAEGAPPGAQLSRPPLRLRCHLLALRIRLFSATRSPPQAPPAITPPAAPPRRAAPLPGHRSHPPHVWRLAQGRTSERVSSRHHVRALSRLRHSRPSPVIH